MQEEGRVQQASQLEWTVVSGTDSADYIGRRRANWLVLIKDDTLYVLED